MEYRKVLPRKLRGRFTLIAVACSLAAFIIVAPLLIWQRHQLRISELQILLGERLANRLSEALAEVSDVRQEMLLLASSLRFSRDAGVWNAFDLMESFLDRLREVSSLRVAFASGNPAMAAYCQSYTIRYGRNTEPGFVKAYNSCSSMGKQGDAPSWYRQLRSTLFAMAANDPDAPCLWTEPYVHDGEMVISCITPFTRGTLHPDLLEGMAVADIPFETLLKKLAGVNMGVPCRIHVLDGQHRQLALIDQSSISSPGEVSIEDMPRPFTGFGDHREHSEDDQAGGWLVDDPLSGGKSMVFIESFASLPLEFLYVIPLKTSSINRSSYDGRILLTGIVITAMIGILFRWVAGLATRNLDLLREGVVALKTGTFPHINTCRVLPDETADLIDTFNTMVEVLQESIRNREELASTRQRMRTELALAHSIQEAVLPGPMKVLGGSLFCVSVPAQEISGDFFDYFTLPGGRTATVVGDVSGKGVSAAMFMMRASLMLRSLAESVEPHIAVSRLNAMLSEANSKMMFVTLFLAVHDPVRERLAFINAGHVPPFILRHNGRLEELGQQSGPALGVLPHREYLLQETPFSDGDMLAIHTDGISDAQDPHGQPFGTGRIRSFLIGNPYASAREIAEGLVQSAMNWQPDDTRFDDMTVAIYKCGSPVRHGSFPASMETLDGVLALVAAGALEVDMGREATGDISLAVCEAVTNVIAYSLRENQCCDYQVYTACSGDDFIVRIEDAGAAFNPDLLSAADISSSLCERHEGGLGWHIIRNVVDSFMMRRVCDTNILTLVRNRKDQPLNA